MIIDTNSPVYVKNNNLQVIFSICNIILQIQVNACICSTKNIAKGLKDTFNYSILINSKEEIPSEIHAFVLNYFVDESNYLNINTKLEFIL